MLNHRRPLVLLLVLLLLLSIAHYSHCARKLIRPSSKVSKLQPYKPILVPENFDWTGVISHYEASELLLSKDKLGPAIEKQINLVDGLSIDLGKSRMGVYMDSTGISLDSACETHLATWAEIGEIAVKKNACFSLYDDGSKPWQINTISKKTGSPASLCAPLSVTDAMRPTLVLGGFTMHRIAGENVSPSIDTMAKIDSVPSIGASPQCKVLDTCMGLGYTAIEAARRIHNAGGGGSGLNANGKVTVIEYDDASLEMSSFNPWSQELFDGTLPIEVLQGDTCEIVKLFSEGAFDVVIHDPPARALCKTDLYGLLFYKDVHRILKKGSGQLFHYIGNPTSKESGRLYKGIISRLQEAGFVDIKMVEAAFGLVATAS
jgi:predicted methyltransferase